MDPSQTAAFNAIELLPTIKDPAFKCEDVMALCLTPTVVSAQWNVPLTHKMWQDLLDKASVAREPVDFPQNREELLLNLTHRVLDFENDLRTSILSTNQPQQKICKLAFAMKFKPRASNDLSHQFLLMKVLDFTLMPIRYELEGNTAGDYRTYQPSYMDRYIPSPGAKHFIDRLKDWPTLVRDVIKWNSDVQEFDKMTAEAIQAPAPPLQMLSVYADRSDATADKRKILSDMIRSVEGLDSATKLRYVDSNLMWAALGLLGCSLPYVEGTTISERLM